MRVYSLCVEKTLSTTVKVKAPNVETAREWLQDNIHEYEDAIEFNDYDADIDVGRSHHDAEFDEDLHPDVLKVDTEWLESNGYEVVISVRKRETVAV